MPLHHHGVLASHCLWVVFIRTSEICIFGCVGLMNRVHWHNYSGWSSREFELDVWLFWRSFASLFSVLSSCYIRTVAKVLLRNDSSRQVNDLYSFCCTSVIIAYLWKAFAYDVNRFTSVLALWFVLLCVRGEFAKDYNIDLLSVLLSCFS